MCCVIPTKSFWALLQAEAEEIVFADSAVLGSTQQHQRATEEMLLFSYHSSWAYKNPNTLGLLVHLIDWIWLSGFCGWIYMTAAFLAK